MFTVLLVIQIMVTLTLVGFVLLQRSDQDGFGLGSGGGGGNSFMTGRGSANLMTRATAILATVFMVNSLFMAVLVARGNDDTSIAEAIERSASVPVIGDELFDAPAQEPVPAPETETIDPDPQIAPEPPAQTESVPLPE